MNEEQKMRLDLLIACGYNIEAARKCLEFVRGGDKDKKQESVCDRLVDGIYLINKYEEIVPFDGKEKVGIEPVTHIGIIQGSHSVAISLQDVSEKKVTLTANESNKDYSGYKDEYMDAVQDWDGKGNTERLEEIGLNSAILLEDDEYIPTLAELYLICLNQKAINEAMRFVGGQELKGPYWSSTESGTTSAWGLYLDGGACCWTKAEETGRVRPVKKFL